MPTASSPKRKEVRALPFPTSWAEKRALWHLTGLGQKPGAGSFTPHPSQVSLAIVRAVLSNYTLLQTPRVSSWAKETPLESGVPGHLASPRVSVPEGPARPQP